VSYLYEWEWECRTEQPQVRESPFTDDEVRDIYDRVTYTLILKHTTDFVNEMRNKGYNITIVRIEPYVRLSWTWEDKVIIPFVLTKRYYYYWLGYGATVKFTSDKPLEGSPIAPVVVSVLSFVIRLVIAALAISLVLYFAKEVIESSKEKTSVVRKYDPQTGKVTEEVITTEKPTLFSGLAGIGAMILLIILALALTRRGEKE